jgi:hypothetical protein
VKPALSVHSGEAVRGSHFKPHEVIRIVFVSGARRVQFVRASAVGSFAALVPSSSDSCAPLKIRATGSSGDVAALALSRGLCVSPNASGTQGTGSQPTTTLPDPHGPPTVNPGAG